MNALYLVICLLVPFNLYILSGFLFNLNKGTLICISFLTLMASFYLIDLVYHQQAINPWDLVLPWSAIILAFIYRVTLGVVYFND